MNKGLHIVPLGGTGNVTLNMYLYIYEDEILIVDCGIGFPDVEMPGADILIPDTTYLHELVAQGKKIVGLLLSHGHEDHIGAAAYILPEFEQEIPIYGSALTIGFTQVRMAESQANPPMEVIKDHKWHQIGEHFSTYPVHMPHSVPDTKHLFIKTPEGTIYHGSDFKLDKDPIDNRLADEEAIKEIAKDGVLCMLIDSLGVEKDVWVPSESTTGPAIEAEMLSTKGKALVTLMSSHIHRIQQTIQAAEKTGRKVTFIGRSVEQNVEVALNQKLLDIPKGMLIDKRDIDNYKDSELCIIIAGSQGQEGSSLMRAIFGQHRDIQINQGDKVIFSASAIPGNHNRYYAAVDELCRNGIDTVYPAIVENLHQSGHAGRQEQQHMVQLVQPKYVMPIGGADRHRVKFIDFVTDPLNLNPEMVLLPAHGEVLSFRDSAPFYEETIKINPRIVDGLGIGDVGPKVLNDRMTLSEAGIIVILIPRAKKGKGYDMSNIEIISRGFVFMSQADEVIGFIKNETNNIVMQAGTDTKEHKLKRTIEGKLSRKLYKIIKREPIIVTEFI